MSTTDTDTTGEDRLLRLLDDQGARWRAGYQPPSFDDAVRRLEGTAAGRRPERWRPLLVAACVLLLVAGVVGVVSAGRRGQAPIPATLLSPTLTWATSDPSGTSSSASSTPPSSVATLSRPPGGFVERPLGDLPRGAANAFSTTPGLVPLRYWAGPHAGETLVLFAGTGAAPTPPGAESAIVRGHPAQLEDIVCASLPSACTSTSVVWNEDVRRYVLVAYGGPGRDAPDGPGLSRAAVLAAADSYLPGASG